MFEPPKIPLDRHMIGTENLPSNSEDAPKSGDQKQKTLGGFKRRKEVEREGSFSLAPASCMSVGGHIIEEGTSGNLILLFYFSLF
jgi:hypothetical protein